MTTRLPTAFLPVESSSRAVPLSQLRQGERATLHATELCCEDCELLNAMGMTDRCEIRVCQRGEPCIVQVHSTRLGISAAMAERIFVSPSGSPAE